MMEFEKKYTVTPEEAIEELEERFWSMSMCMTVAECKHHNECIRMAIDAIKKYRKELSSDKL